jgi:hypothetical protein
MRKSKLDEVKQREVFVLYCKSLFHAVGFLFYSVIPCDFGEKSNKMRTEDAKTEQQRSLVTYEN